MNRYLLVLTLFVVAGCATPSAEPSKSESFQATESSNNALLDHIDPAEVFEDAEVVAGNYENSGDVAESFEGIEDVEAPSVVESPATMAQQPQMVEPEVVCERMVPTGSVMHVRVCRRQSDIDRNKETDQKIMDDIKRNTANGASRL
jgi:hypothetical protein